MRWLDCSPAWVVLQDLCEDHLAERRGKRSEMQAGAHLGGGQCQWRGWDENYEEWDPCGKDVRLNDARKGDFAYNQSEICQKDTPGYIFVGSLRK